MKKITKTPLAGIAVAMTKTSLACPQARSKGPTALPAGGPELDFALESTPGQTVRSSEFCGHLVVLVNNKGSRHAMASLQKTILIAEDSPDDVFLLRCAYAKTGLPYDLRFVCNGREAIDYLEGNPPFDRQSHPLPAAIILDIQMPLLTGLEVLAWLKLHPTLSHIPAVVHSSSILDIDRNKIAELGARKCFVKSPNQDDQIAMFQSIAAFITDSETSAAASTALDAEHFTVLEGTLQIATCYKTLDVPAGATVSLSRGVPHAWCNLSDVPLRVVIVFSPGQIEGMLREVIGWNVDDVSAILDKFGCLIVGPALIDNTSSSNSPSRSR